jgi:predicted DCC family thiol-disulfide oxidoreductase YuxK
MLVFDGECPFCRVWVEYWKRLTGEQILYEPFQEVGSQFPQISQGDFASAVKLVLPDGEVRSGAHAVFSPGQEMDVVVLRASFGICRGF